MMIFKDVQLVWTAKTQTAPIYVNTLRVGGLEGLIVTLSDSGWLQLVYLGTDAPGSAVQSEGQPEMSYEQMDAEHQRLLARIRNHEEEKQAEPDDRLVISPTLSSVVEGAAEYVDDSEGALARNEKGKVIRMSMKVTLGYKAS